MACAIMPLAWFALYPLCGPLASFVKESTSCSITGLLSAKLMFEATKIAPAIKVVCLNLNDAYIDFSIRFKVVELLRSMPDKFPANRAK